MLRKTKLCIIFFILIMNLTSCMSDPDPVLKIDNDKKGTVIFHYKDRQEVTKETSLEIVYNENEHYFGKGGSGEDYYLYFNLEDLGITQKQRVSEKFYKSKKVGDVVKVKYQYKEINDNKKLLSFSVLDETEGGHIDE